MQTNITNIDTTTPHTFPWLGVDPPASDSQLFYLEYLGYGGPEPESCRHADALIDSLVCVLPVEGNGDPDESGNLSNKRDEKSADGYSMAEDHYTRRMRLRWKEIEF